MMDRVAFLQIVVVFLWAVMTWSPIGEWSSVCEMAVKAADWQPAAGPLMTPWAKDVRPDKVWPEYPRPQMERAEWINLNGLWDYAIVPRDQAWPERWDGKILVPFCVESALSGVMRPVSPEERLWYRRTFVAPPLAEGQRLLLHFEAVDWKTTVWLNRQALGEHTGGYDPFSFDITDALRPGENELVVAVWDPTDTGWQPRGKQVLKPHGIWYTAVTGIWQTVWLEPVPAQSIRSLRLVPDVDQSTLWVNVEAPSGWLVRLKAMLADRTVSSGEGKPGEKLALKIPEPKLWSPDNPTLYNLIVTLVCEGRAVDQVRSYFGMRKIEVAKDDQGVNRIFLNGEPIFQFGPLDQGWWPDGLYTAPTDEALRYDVEMTKKYGMNAARKHVKYEPRRWYYWCDRLGLLVWQDMPSGDLGRNEESRANFRKELKAMIDSRFNHPSIIMWVPFNEGWGQHDTCEIADWVKSYDPSRLVNEASGWHDHGCGEVSDMHQYPGPAMRPLEAKRAVVLGEFGGLGLPLEGHLWKPEGAWGYVGYKDQQTLTDAYVALLTKLRPLIGQGLCAAIYTQTSDVEIEVNGLMTYDRKVAKIDLGRAAEAARKLYLPPPEVRVLVPTSENQPQLWRFTTVQPPGNWMTPDFDDSAWQEGPGGFGTKGTPGSVVRTEWKTAEIWLRRSFEVESALDIGQLVLELHHDEDAEVYINGIQVAKTTGFLTNYILVPIKPDLARKAIRPGKNTLAVHCRQTRGGQYIDVGISVLIETARK